MIFKRMLGALGVGAPSVDTVLTTPRVLPGGVLSGEVRLRGGDFDAEIEHVALGLVAKAEAEHGEGEQVGLAEFFRAQVAGPFTLRQGEEQVIPFQIPVPWETPISEVGGRHLHGMAIGVRTELAIAKAVDKGDLDPVAVAPLPSQERVLQAFAQLGFGFKSADLEMGHIYGVRQELPFYQEIELYPPHHYAGLINEVELTFVTSPEGLDVILEADKRTGRYGSEDAIGRFHVSHDQAVHMDWPAEIERWLSVLSQYGFGGGSHHHGHGYHGHDYHGHGPGIGGAVAAGAVGFVGGMVAGEIVEEVVEEIFEGDDEGGDW